MSPESLVNYFRLRSLITPLETELLLGYCGYFSSFALQIVILANGKVKGSHNPCPWLLVRLCRNSDHENGRVTGVFAAERTVLVINPVLSHFPFIINSHTTMY